MINTSFHDDFFNIKLHYFELCFLLAHYFGIKYPNQIMFTVLTS